MKKSLLISAGLLLVLFSCRKDPLIETGGLASNDPYQPFIPKGWPAPAYTFENNTVTFDGYMLGRHLFYEPMLSADTTISCASCHQQNFAFTNGPSHPVSHGVQGLLGHRNTPALFNLSWSPQLRWDGGVNNLENQPLNPIQDPAEMNLPIASAVNRLANSAKYKELFKKAYGDTLVNSQRLLKAFAQFMGLMISNNSKYDQVKRGEDAFTVEENNGYNVFKAKCGVCHVEPLFSDYKFRNKGLPITFYQDSGRYSITGSAADLFKFKTPSLRNLAFSAPYMHDGRFGSIEDVLNFFVSGVATSLPNIDPYMSVPHSISAQEKNDLLSFLNTLNDYQFINDERFKPIQ